MVSYEFLFYNFTKIKGYNRFSTVFVIKMGFVILKKK